MTKKNKIVLPVFLFHYFPYPVAPLRLIDPAARTVAACGCSCPAAAICRPVQARPPHGGLAAIGQAAPLRLIDPAARTFGRHMPACASTAAAWRSCCAKSPRKLYIASGGLNVYILHCIIIVLSLLCHCFCISSSAPYCMDISYNPPAPQGAWTAAGSSP